MMNESEIRTVSGRHRDASYFDEFLDRGILDRLYSHPIHNLMMIIHQLACWSDEETGQTHRFQANHFNDELINKSPPSGSTT